MKILHVTSNVKLYVRNRLYRLLHFAPMGSLSCESFSHVVSTMKFNRFVIGLKIKEKHISGINIWSHVTTGKHGDDGVEATVVSINDKIPS